MKKIITILTAFTVLFTMIPASGDIAAIAASPYWNNMKVRITEDGSAKISWKALTGSRQKKISGIAVYRNGKRIRKLKKGSDHFCDRNLRSGKTYSYRLKTYRKTKKKMRMYYNRKTGKWQKKKIKGARTKVLRKTVYKYSNASDIMRVKKKAVTPQDDGTEAEMVQITDFTGAVRTVVRNGELFNNPIYNRDVDGVFANGDPGYIPDGSKAGERYFIQRSGVTIWVDHCSNGYMCCTYNGDDSRISLELSRDEYQYTKWGNELESPSSETATYIFGDNGRRLAEVEREFNGVPSNTNVVLTDLLLDKGTVTITAKYDGKVVDTYNLRIDNSGRAGRANGMTDEMQKAYDIAKRAVAFFENGGSCSYFTQEMYRDMITEYGEYYARMHAIEDYVRDNYRYEEMSCAGGYAILKAYSIIEYGEYGHWVNPIPANTGHMAFRPDSYCAAGSYSDPGRSGEKASYFQTNGHN